MSSRLFNFCVICIISLFDISFLPLKYSAKSVIQLSVVCPPNQIKKKKKKKEKKEREKESFFPSIACYSDMYLAMDKFEASF